MDRFTYPTSVRLSSVYTDDAGDEADPTAPVLKVKPPRGATVSIAASSLTHDGTGLYSYVLASPMVGIWTWEWDGAIDGVAIADKGKFRVEPAL